MPQKGKRCLLKENCKERFSYFFDKISTTEMDQSKIISLIHDHWKDVQGIYLYGSRAKAHEKNGSDVDLAVLAKGSLSETARWELAQLLASVAKCDVDLIDLRQVSTVLQFQVISTGKQIDRIDQKVCEDFENYVYVSYARLNEERRGILKDIQDRGSVF